MDVTVDVRVDVRMDGRAWAQIFFFLQLVREKWIPDALIFPKGAGKVAVILDLTIRMKSRLRRRLRRRLRLWLRPVAYAPVGFRTCRAFPAPAGQFSGQL